MKYFVKSLSLFILIGAGWNAVKAQRTEILILQPKHVNINSSCFSNVEVIDTRLDTSSLGHYHKGGLNRMMYLTSSQPLKVELAGVVTNMISGASKQEGTLLINVRQFAATEFFGLGGENGVFRLSAVFYLKKASVYRKILTVNTNVVVKSFIDVSQKLLDTVPEVLGNYIQQVAGFDTAHIDSTTRFTAKNFESLDYREKELIPVYQVDIPQKGLYATFEDFKNNRPSRPVIIVQQEYELNKPLVYEMKEDGRKGKKIKYENFYAICDGANMFISGNYGLYPLTKNDNDFYFKSIGKEGGDGEPLEGGQNIIIGRSGILPYDWAIVVFRIDHITGKFIPVRRVSRE